MTESFLQVCLHLSLVLLGVSLVFTALRVVLGPTLADRVLALDTLSVLAIGFVGVYALASGLFVLFDIALGLAAASFLSTAAFARFIRSRRVRAPQPAEAGGKP
ncbi:MAG TPA: monovalent cation/H+ antiporter complex subunit F [Mesorhizobium sp.]|jgi:multicomponent Na+:H+ antiporter subunit F|nr:monovalent cation/H+ antiporter complex subunit F [Mesorhizobium sp.]